MILLAASLTTACSGDSADVPETDIHIGMSVANFRKIHPEAEIRSSGQFRKRETVKGLDGNWTFSFLDKELSWFVFNAYEEKVNPENFQAIYESAQALIGRYTEVYGSPAGTAEGITHFADPAKALHEGYEVISAEWRMGSEYLAVRFNFIGDRSKYAFLVTVEGKRI